MYRKYKKKLVVISTIIPSDYGARPKVVLNYLKILSEKYDYNISLIIINNHIQCFDTPFFLDGVYFFNQPHKLIQITQILINSLILRKSPMQSYLFWSPFLNKKIKNLVTKLNPDIVFCELIRTALFGININFPNILDMADLLSRRYGQQLKNISDYSNITGQYEKTYPKFIRKIINSAKIKYFILNMEYQLTRDFENNVVKYFNLTTLVSTHEVKMLIKTSNNNKIQWLPNGIDIKNEFFPSDKINNKIISFIGILDNPHNEFGVLYFIDEIFPLVLEKVPDAIFQVIGRNPSNKIISRKQKNIIITGYVENLNDYIDKSTITVVPLKIGSGVKTKIFDSIKFGVPVVATSLGAEGVINELSEYIYVHDDANEFAQECARLLLDNVYLKKDIRAKGFEIIKNNYSWESIGAKLQMLISQTSK